MSDEIDFKWKDLDLVNARPPEDLTILSGKPSELAVTYANKYKVNQLFYFADLNDALIASYETGFEGIFSKYNKLASLFFPTWDTQLNDFLIPKISGAFAGPTSGTVTVYPTHPYYYGAWEGDYESFRQSSLASLFFVDNWYDSGRRHPSITRLLWEAVFESAVKPDYEEDTLLEPYKIYALYSLNHEINWRESFADDHLELKKAIIKFLKDWNKKKFMDYCKARWGLEYTDAESFCQYFINLAYFNQWYELILVLKDMLDNIRYMTIYPTLVKDDPQCFSIDKQSDDIQESYEEDEMQIKQMKDRMKDAWNNRELDEEKGSTRIGWGVYKRTGQWPGYRRTYEGIVVSEIAGETLGGWTAASLVRALPLGVKNAWDRYREDWTDTSICEALSPIAHSEVAYATEHTASVHDDELPPNPSVNFHPLSSLISPNFLEDEWHSESYYDPDTILNDDLLAFRDSHFDEDVGDHGCALPLDDFPSDIIPTIPSLIASTIDKYENYPSSWYETNYEFYAWYEPQAIVIDLFSLIDDYANPDPDQYW